MDSFYEDLIEANFVAWQHEINALEHDPSRRADYEKALRERNAGREEFERVKREKREARLNVRL
ncbi:hypothetical protein [Ochrobactrum sp. RH2CCR150]|uniref:hypothetical protein n=1 Tax=Ochrobactrum sp. RH2CCR150 TaxID=2587044 RepID=UPI0015F84D58|nr:hypothetical protein [Ochrobactrum sp. RH2CCR150]